ncbi:MAG TPA: glycosyltransferase family 4 protein [Steroidobacteraceae bacterium]|nr:glycosyltransferase family 4 protein [Steroidobacteraceae bacterium]
MKRLRLAIISTHPIQYYAPLFSELERSRWIQPRVFFTWSQSVSGAVHDPGFGREVRWDVPLLEGYEYEFVPNIAPRPGTERFFGVRNPGLIHAIKRWNADAVLVFGWNLASHLQAMRYFKGRLPVFFRGDSTLLDAKGVCRSAARRVLLRWVYRHIDVALAVGSNNQDYFRWCGVPEQRIVVAPHAIDTGRFSDPHGRHQARAASWRAELGIGPDARAVLFAGKFLRKKDPLLLLQAYLECGAPGHLIFVGNGPLEESMRACAGARTNIHFLPFQNQQAMPAVYRLAEVFALTSRGPGETWGLAINEAMASGRAVMVSSKAGGARDLVVPGQNGWLFQSGNRQQLAAALQSALMRDPRELRRMGEAAQRHGARWSIEAAAESIARAVIEFSLQKRHSHLLQ